MDQIEAENIANRFGDELVDKCNEIRAIAAKKYYRNYDAENPYTGKWTNPSSVSLARLDKVKTNIYNLGLTDARDLKAAASVRDRNHRNKQLSQLLTDPPLSTVSLQKNAWGSNSSIPELIKQHSEASKPSPTRQRPSSAKTSAITRPPSGRKQRPQSAKDIPQSSDSRDTTTITVKGSKYDPSGRPPRAPPGGMAVGVGWVGPPAGLKLDPELGSPSEFVFGVPTLAGDQGGLDADLAQFEFSTGGPPPAPCASPEQGEGTLDNFSDVDSLHCESHKSILLRKPTPEVIHLSLPTAEDEDVELDELDTERLLREAENQVTQTKQAPLVKYDQKSGISYRGPVAGDTKLSPHDEEQTSGRRSPSLYDINAHTLPVSAPASAHVHRARLALRSATGARTGVLFREDRNVTVNITPRNMGRKVQSMSAGRRYSAKKKITHVDYSHVKSRVNSGIDASALIAERRLSKSDLTAPENNDLGLELNVKPVSRNQSRPNVPMVTVKYDEHESDKSTGSSCPNETEKKKKVRKEIDLVTMVSQVSLTESEDNVDDESTLLETNNSNVNSSFRKNIANFLHPPSNPKLYRSQTQKNYYEVAMRTDRGKSPDRNNVEEKENVVYKTIKTIEFNAERPVEKCERSVIPGTFLTTKPREKMSVTTDYLEQKRASPRASTASIKIPSKAKEEEKVEETDKGKEAVESTSGIAGFGSLSPEDLEVLAKAAEETERKMKSMFLVPPPPANRSRAKTEKTRAKPKREPTADENVIKIHNESAISFNMEGDDELGVMRPKSCYVSSDRKLNGDTRRIQSAATAERGGLKRYASYSQSKLSKKKENWDLENIVFINTKKTTQDVETEENLACQEMTSRMAELGCNVRPETLERALFPPSGKTLYYDLTTEQPMAPSDGLLSHPRFWLPKEYNKFKLAEKQLARAEHMLWLQKKDEDRRTKSAMDLKAPSKKKKKKGKSKGKKGKAARSNSIC